MNKGKAQNYRHVKAVQVTIDGNGARIQSDRVNIFELSDWDKMKELKPLNWDFIEMVPPPSPGDVPSKEKTGGKEMKLHPEHQG